MRGRCPALSVFCWWCVVLHVSAAQQSTDGEQAAAQATSSNSASRPTQNVTDAAPTPGVVIGRSLEERLEQQQNVLQVIREALLTRRNPDGNSSQGACAPKILKIHYDNNIYVNAAAQAVANAQFMSNLWAAEINPAGSCRAVIPGAACGDFGVYADQLLVFERMRTAVLANSNVFASGGCYGNEVMSYACNLTCVYARRNVTYQEVRADPNKTEAYGRVSLEEISYVPAEILLPANDIPTWFTGPADAFNATPIEERSAKYGHRVLTELSDYASLGGRQHWDTHVTYEHGFWTDPYFDCPIGGEWMVSFMMPIVVAESSAAATSAAPARNGTGPAPANRLRFLGVTGVDIELSKVDINQCLVTQHDGLVFSNDLMDTHLCSFTTDCVHVAGGGFEPGSYQCRCKPNYYYIDPNSTEDGAAAATQDDAPAYHSGFNGHVIEAAVRRWRDGKCRDDAAPKEEMRCLARAIERRFACRRCHETCGACTDGTTCLYEVNRPLVIVLSAVNLGATLIAAFFAVFIVLFRARKAIKAASWPFLITALAGAVLMYSPGITRPSISLDTAKIRCKLNAGADLVGFSLLYGSIFIKIWRIQQMISPKFLKKSLVRGQTLDSGSLAKRLVLLLVLTALYLVMWMLVQAPEIQFQEVAGGLNFYRCVDGPFGYGTTGVQLGLMVWGAYLCQRTRNVAAKFTDSRELSISIYMFLVVFSLAKTLEYALLSGKRDEELLLDTLRVQMTVTVTLMIIFVPKLIHVYHGTAHYKRKRFQQSRRRGNSRTSQISAVSFDHGKTLQRSSRPSALSRSRSSSGMLSVPLERHVSTSTIAGGNFLTVDSSRFFLQRTSSLAMPDGVGSPPAQSSFMEGDEGT